MNENEHEFDRPVQAERADVRVGLLLPTREAALTGNHDPAGLLSLAERAEAAGYASVWAGDSPLARPRHDPLTLLSAVAARTRRIEIGTAVLLGALRQPLLFAHAAATLDQLSQGRLILGLGTGFPNPATTAEFAAAGVPFDRRIARLYEATRLWCWLWSASSEETDPLPFAGRHWRIERARLFPAPAQPHGPRLWLGAAGPAALRRVGRSFDGWLPYSPAAQLYAEGWQVIRQAAGEADRPIAPITPALYATIALNPDPRAARERLDAYMQAYYGQPLAVMSTIQACYAGDTDSCIAWLQEYIAAGARHIVLRFAMLDGHEAAVEAAASRLLPRLQQAGERQVEPVHRR